MTGNGRHNTTVIDRIRALKYATENRLCAMSADRIWKEYGQATGELPQKVRRAKTNGYQGTHLVAAFPEWFESRMDAIIGEVATQIEAADNHQGSLFEYE
jgi:hypothetical protein